MTECKTCPCGWYPSLEETAYKAGRYLVICRHCFLRTRTFPTGDEAVKAWNAGKFSKTARMLNQKLTKDTIDDNGAIYLTEGIYNRAVLDYEEALKHPEQVQEHRDKHYIQVRKEVETMFRKGYYIGYRPGEKGIRILKGRLEERERRREEARKKAEEDAKKRKLEKLKLARAAGKKRSRKKQAS